MPKANFYSAISWAYQTAKLTLMKELGRMPGSTHAEIRAMYFLMFQYNGIQAGRNV